jgi:alpha-ketoglutarate-dependent taurine dioxygenase
MEMRRATASRPPAFKSIKPRTVSLGGEGTDLVRTRLLDAGATLPLVVEPAADDVDLAVWARLNRAFVERALHRHGALLFRGFGIDAVEPFEAFSLAVCDELYDENGEHEMVSGSVATPVFYPPDRQLLWHNENSFNHIWPTRILFCCAVAPAAGGETPIVDSRQVYARLDPGLRERFAARQVMYQRNYGGGLGLDWTEVFRTRDRAEVERRCRDSRTGLEWQAGGRLRTRAVRPAVARHPVTGEICWFNQAQHWHIACLDRETRDSLAALFNAEALPRHCFYGDGSEIADADMDAILAAYRELEVSFPWRRGDVLLLDNLLAAHGRNPFAGPRKILVTMGNMQSWDEV